MAAFRALLCGGNANSLIKTRFRLNAFRYNAVRRQIHQLKGFAIPPSNELKTMYTQLAEIPVPTAAQFLTSNDSIIVTEITYSVRDHVRNAKRTVTKSIVVTPKGDVVATTTLQDVDIVGQALSPSGKKKALLRNVKGGSSRVIEIWNNGALEASMDVTDQHGDFYTDEYLSSVAFSSSESTVLYVAEGKAPETKNPFEKYRFNPDFGEGLDGKRRPTVFLYKWDDLSSATSTKQGSLARLRTPEGIRFGQAIFSPNSENIIYATGYEFTQDGRLLGVKGCYNRPTGIWQLQLDSHDSEETPKELVDINTKVLKLTPPHQCCRSPRIVTRDGKSSLLWLASPSGGAHIATHELHSLDIASDVQQSLKDLASKPHITVVDVPNVNGFPGLYPTYNIPKDFLLESSNSILLHSQWGSRTVLLQISLAGAPNDVKNLTHKSTEDLYSWTMLATDSKSRFICSRSSPSVPYEIVLGQLAPSGEISWRVIDKPALPKFITSALSDIRTSIVPIPDRGLVETIVIQGKPRKDGTVPPCITSPHGGPHGTTSTTFSASTTALVLEGYTLAFPNYTGSPGFGEKFLQGLVGKCGELDVQDCMASTKHLISLDISKEGPGMQLVMGGSHGGFLTGHLIGQFPTFFSGAIMRNPVTSVGELSNGDIPDWYYAEFGHPYPISSSQILSMSVSLPEMPHPPLMTAETYASLRLASPIYHIDNVCIPVLLLIGAADRRVAPTQGIEYYHALKARYAKSNDTKKDPKKKVEMLMFEGESHPLDGVEAAKAGFEVTREWFASAVSA